MEQDVKRNYDYRRLPDNIRQIGESSGRSRVYIEDYVLTYIRRVFQDKQENSIVVFVGCEGKEAAAGSLFLYGAIEIPLDQESSDMQEEQWDMLFHQISQYFPYGRIMGWGCGVGIWNSEVDYRVRRMQEEQFAEDSSILFLADLSEREEKVFIYHDHDFEELSGYFVYYERNPQMQEYMLREQPKGDGFEADYEDEVTQNIRTVIHTKQSRQKKIHYLTYGMACVLLLMILAGGNLLIRSLAKINSLEETIETLSQYVAENRQDPSSKAAMSQMSGEQNAQAATQAATDLPTGAPAAQPTGTVAQSGVADHPLRPETATPLPLATVTPLPLQTSQQEKVATAKAVKKNKTDKAKKTVKNIPEAVVAGGVDRIKQTYIVRKGDTLSQIVWNQYHSFAYMDRVQRVNQIEDTDRIYIGQCILLPDA